MLRALFSIVYITVQLCICLAFVLPTSMFRLLQDAAVGRPCYLGSDAVLHAFPSCFITLLFVR